jgi:type IVB pilus formation R64 PilN family outer membrane protein
VSLPSDSIPIQALIANLPPVQGAGVPGNTGGSVGTPTVITLNHQGPVRSLLDTVAASIGGYWRYDAGTNTVTLYRLVTEAFRIAAVVGTENSTASIGTQTGGGSSSVQITAGKAGVEHKTDASPWKDVETTVKSLLSPEGVFVLNPSLGTLVVRDRPDRIEVVRDYVNRVNQTLAVHVGFDVRIYRVEARDQDVRGINWIAYFNRFAENATYRGFYATNLPAAAENGTSSFVLRVNETVDGVPQRWGGSQFIVEALSLLGTTSVVTSTYAQTTNNTPAPVRNTRRRAYLAQSSQAVAGGGTGAVVASGTQLQPGEVETGLVMYLLPHVQDDGKRLLLKMMLSLSTLDRLDTFVSGEQRIQLPQVSSREYQQTLWLNSGETLVIAGFEQVLDAIERESPLDARLWGLGGRSSAANQRETFVITITPTVQSAQSTI